MKFSLAAILLSLLLMGCHSEQDQSGLDGLPVHTPGVITEFDSLNDEIYFSHLGYATAVLDDGSLFIPDRELSTIFIVTDKGDLVSTAAREGRGPGELQDITFLSRSHDSSILVYDQMNNTVYRFSSAGEYLKELTLQPWDRGRLSEVYDMDEDHLLTVYRSFEYLRNTELEPEAHLVPYNKTTEQYMESVTIPDRAFARTIIDGEVRGGRMVPYSPEHLRAYDPAGNTLAFLWTEGQEIAHLTPSLDTTQTVSFELEREPLSRDEISEIRDYLTPDAWRSMEPLLPGLKSIADDMIIDDQQRFWLKLNHRSEVQKWLILSPAGEKLALVHLPGEGMLTHVHSHHLGFRIDDHIFALLEPVQIDE
jgi:hypothetical protein